MIRASHIETARAPGAAPAAPAGGAQPVWGRGCGYMAWFSLSVVVCFLVLGLGFFQPVAAQSDTDTPLGPVQVPSGQEVALAEVLLDDSPGELWARFRFVAPGIERAGEAIGGNANTGMTYEQSAADMDHLCRSLALNYLRRFDLAPQLVVISLSDRPVTFGTQNAAATQFFEAYRPAGDDCIWEAF